MPTLDANEIWEFFFGELKGAVPEELTDEVLAKLAEHINREFVARPPHTNLDRGTP